MSNNIEQNRINPLLETLKRIPGETFRLPSRGMFYSNGELDPEVKNGEVTIYPMTTKEELLMQSVDAIFQGTAIEKTILQCVPQIKKPRELLASDIDFLLTCIRKVTFGDTIKITHKCKSCEEKKEQNKDEKKSVKEREYEISLSHFISNTKEITKEDYEGCIIKLDDKFEVKVKPMTFSEILRIQQLETPSEPQKLPQEQQVEILNNLLVESLSSLIERVNNVTDKEMIKEWLSSLYSNLREELSEKLETYNNWGIKFNYKIKCKECNSEEDIGIHLNPTSFFMLPSNRKTKKK